MTVVIVSRATPEDFEPPDDPLAVELAPPDSVEFP